MEQCIFFDVAFADKDRAKKLGAQWDIDKRSWFAPNEEVARVLSRHFKAHLTDPTPITVLPGEDRSFGGNSLYVDLVPSSCWFTNVRYCIEPNDWKRLSKGIRARANQTCEICQGAADIENGVFLEAHERWQFDDEQRVQALKRIVCMCTACHRTTHYGLARLQGEEELVRDHFKSVNDCDDGDLNEHVSYAFDTWQERNEIEWELDLSIITNAGITLKRPVVKQDRRQIARDEVESHDVDQDSDAGVHVREITLDVLDTVLSTCFGMNR